MTARRRPQGEAAKPLSPSQENGTPPLVSPRVVGGTTSQQQQQQHRHHHNQQQQQQLNNNNNNNAAQSLDLDAFDDDEAGAAAAMSDAMAGVVKVYASHAEPSFNLPWQRKRQFASTSSGFAISIPDEGTGAPVRRILTNAHSVDYYNQVKVRERESRIFNWGFLLSSGSKKKLSRSRSRSLSLVLTFFISLSRV